MTALSHLTAKPARTIKSATGCSDEASTRSTAREQAEMGRAEKCPWRARGGQEGTAQPAEKSGSSQTAQKSREKCFLGFSKLLSVRVAT